MVEVINVCPLDYLALPADCQAYQSLILKGNLELKTREKIHHIIVTEISRISGIPLTSLTLFTEEHLHALVVTTQTAFGKNFLVDDLNLNINDIRQIAKSGLNDNYSDFYRELGLSEHWVRLWNSKFRYEYLKASGFGRKLILEYAQNLVNQEALSISKEEKAAKLVQTDYKNSQTITCFMSSKINYTAALALDFELVDSARNLHIWPQGFLVNYPEDAELAYEHIKTELDIIDNDWKSLTSRQIANSTKYGTKMLSQFKNSIYDMVMFFDEVEPQNIVNKQGHFYSKKVLKTVIEGALKEFHNEKGHLEPKKVKDLPKISLKQMSKNSKLSSYISAISRIHKTSHPHLMCELFPEMNWVPSDFTVSGVPDNFWFSEINELNVDHATAAIERMLTEMYTVEQLNDRQKKLQLVGMLTQGDFRQHHLGVLGSPNNLSGGQGWTTVRILQACYPGVDVSHKVHTKSALRFYRALEAENIVPHIDDPLSLMEKRLKKAENLYLFDDLHLELKVNGSVEKVVFELQGSQHYKTSSKFYSSSIVENDAFKFVHHQLKGTRIFYVKSELLPKAVWKKELQSQGFNIEEGIANSMTILERAQCVEKLGLVHKGFTDHVNKLLEQRSGL